MNDADFTLKWTEELKIEISKIQFANNDIRKDYYGLIYDVAYVYYKGILMRDICKFISNGKIVFKNELTPYEIHFNRLAKIEKLPILQTSHLNSLNRSFMIDSWSVFELCVTTFCKGIATSNELNSLLESNYLEIINMLKNTEINPKDEAKIRKQNIKKSLTHISINRKINFLFKKVNNYGRDINSDKNFLEFFAKFRNTLHTNFIYYGNHYEYKFNEAHFVFENEKLVKWYDPWFRSPILYFNLLTELNNIWREIINCIEHQEIVNYPDEEQD